MPNIYYQPNVPSTGKRWKGSKKGTKAFPGSEYTPEEVDWLRAVIKWKAMHEWKGYIYPHEDVRAVLTIARCLGYRRTG